MTMADDTDIVDFEELFQFAADRAAGEDDDFDGSVPHHADRLIVSTAADLQKTLVNVEMTEASETADDPNEDAVRSALEEDVVDIMLAIGALKYEHDLDIATAFEERIEFMKEFREFEEAMREADDDEEQMEVMDELMTDEIAEHMGHGMMAAGGGVQPGDNVDNDDYDHDEEGRAYA